MTDIIAAVPGFWLLAGASLAAVLAEVVILLVSRARLARQENAARLAANGDWQAVAALVAPSRALEIAAASIPLALAAAYARTIHGSRGLLVAAMSGTEPAEKAALASRAIAGDLNATPLGILSVGVAAAVGCVAVGLAIGARRHALGLHRAATLAAGAPDEASAWLKHPGPSPWAIVVSIAAFLLLGVGPIARAEYRAVILKIQRFASATGDAAQVEDRGSAMSGALDEAGRLLDDSLPLARAGVGVATVVVLLVAWRLSAARARARLLGGRSPPRAGDRQSAFGPAVACCAIAGAAAVFVAARPLRGENRLRWPPYDGADRLTVTLATPDLDGPDVLQRAPLIHVTPQDMRLDGQEADAAWLEATLGTLRRNYTILRPDIPFNELVIMACQPDASADRVSAALRAARRAGFSRPMFAFLRREDTDRPLFGLRSRTVARAAETTAVEDRRDAGSDATIISTAKFATCAALSQEIVAARRAGRDVALLLPPSE